MFTRDGAERTKSEFPWLTPYVQRVLRSDCNAFYLNPLQLENGSRVDLRSYCKDIHVPLSVAVLYVDVPAGMIGGELVLARGKKSLARVRPMRNLLIEFDGDLTHSVERVETSGRRLSLVCEQYALTEDELEQIPPYAVESRAGYGRG